MGKSADSATFKAKLLRAAVAAGAAPYAFVVLPKTASDLLPRRGRTTVDGTLNSHRFRVTLEPDGQLSHWLRIEQSLLEAAGVKEGDSVTFKLAPVSEEPEPEVPADLQEALAAHAAARTVWDDTTTIARVDWIHWITSAKQARTRVKRIADACDMLASGERRVCCFDTSGFYSKAFSAPKVAE